MKRKILTTGKFWLLLLIIFSIAFVFYGAVWPEAPILVPDSANYQSLALDLQDGSLDNLHGRTPGYPLLLIATGSVTGAARALFFVQLLLHIISVAFLAWMLLRFSLPKRWVVLFALLAMLPYNIVHTAYALTETLAQFLLVSGIVALTAWLDKVKWYLIVLSSISLAFSALVRPTYQFLVIVLVVILLLLATVINGLRNKLVGAAMALALGAVIILGSMITFNATNFNLPSLTPDLGFFLSTKTARVLERLPESYEPARGILIRHRDQLLLSADSYHTGYMYIWSAIPELQQQTNLSYRDLAQYMMNLNLDLIVKAPLIYLQEVGYSFINFWLPATTELSDFSSRWVQLLWSGMHFLTILAFLGVSILIGGGILLLFTLFGDRKNRMMNQFTDHEQRKAIFIGLSFITILYTIAVTIFTDMGVARHRLPVELFIFTIIFLGVDTWGRMRKWFVSRGQEIQLLLNMD